VSVTSASRIPAGTSPPRRRRRLLRRLLAGLAALLVLLVLLVVGVTLLVTLTPSVSDAPRLVARRLAAERAPLLTRLPARDRVGEAVIATEDGRFYSHFGVDPVGLVRALVGEITGGGDHGGATLDQQLAKELYTPKDTWQDRIEDVGLALKIDHDFTKSRILLMYLNAAYYGNGYYGVLAASRGYFGVPPGRLSWGQAALIAGLVQAPSGFDPTRHFHLARAKQLHVLHRLVAIGVLNPAQARAAYLAPLHPAVPFRG
jgi:membrane peptidoglycan carboxypeptidase